ncbi:MAG: hypothetical protein JSV97_11760, partial [candidate division WOR-3 bacterium]
MCTRLMYLGTISLVAIFLVTEISSAAVIPDLIVEGPSTTTLLDTGQVLFQFTAPYNNTDGMAWDGT